MAQARARRACFTVTIFLRECLGCSLVLLVLPWCIGIRLVVGIGDAAEDIVKRQPDEAKRLIVRVRSDDYSTRMVATLQSQADGRRHTSESTDFKPHLRVACVITQASHRLLQLIAGFYAIKCGVCSHREMRTR